MTDAVVSFVLEELSKFVKEEGNSLTGIEREFKDIKYELESIQVSLKDADTKAADEGGGGANEGIKTWVKQLREASFRIEDVIDEYEYSKYMAENNNHSGFIASLQMIPNIIKTMNSRHQIASEIQDIKLSLGEIKERSQWYAVKSESGLESYRGVKAPRIDDTRMAPYFIQETQVVGFESPKDELVRCLVGGTSELMLVSVVGMGGIGKTTLASHVFQNQVVKNYFDCRYFVTVSQSYTLREMLIDMVKKFFMDNNEPIPKFLWKMDNNTLITHVRQHLQSKRYLLLFDDVWKESFSDEIEDALISNDKGSRIIVTSRMMHVAEYFKKSFLVHIHHLQPLPPNKAWELFCNKAFRGQCPAELEDISNDVVQKCGGLPMAIVATAGLLSTKAKTVFEWKKASKNLRMELERNVHLTSLIKILSLSYDDLPSHLKSCMLYFGIYPEDYTITTKRLTRQWMAEGFVRCEERRNPENVAEEYLTELIQRSLIHVSKVGFDGKIKSCQVHNLLREVILRKMQDLSFCHLMHEGDEQVTVGITRRFSIASISKNVLRSTSNSGIRAIFVFDKDELSKDFMDGLSAKFKLLKVLDFENSLLNFVPDNLGNLFHLKYLNLSRTKVTVLPRSIGNLVNLESLDLRHTTVDELPREINKLTKLRLLPVYYRKYDEHYSMLNFTTGVQIQEGIGCLKSLQQLYFLDADHGGIDLIQELKMLRKLRKLGIRRVRQEYGNELCATIQKMNHLESLYITAIDEEVILDLDFVSAPPNLKVLNLEGRLTKLPNWIPKLQYLVKLRLSLSNFEHDPLDTLKNLPNLLRLNLWDDAFSGDSLHFSVGGFPKLKELDLTRLNRLSFVSIDKDALVDLEHFRFNNNPQLKVLPKDLQNLKNLQFLGFADMPATLVDSINPEKGGPCHWIINHIPLVRIRQTVGSKFHDYKLYSIPTQFKV
ncbi:putative P-loop containing nucleoside triphosphate hydrolase, leucine-rich repeat domain, L [Medicago truncatula]|uniref:NBS-LRR type disease resistance protein n=1 Tax=Medicago truncatula TaxID=3880 RepID=A0A072UUD6_MEDTR|nr:disease resistance protein RPM1 [Medicago truncatula]KEH32961.1 NBS-LRR type disease resistance protein [Medicago truncatula]RHN65561.1 putative P-loop containing nucleoside triphosphate hydrolase, leucine-rich repeat domain, L [Medicago truncatula]